MGVLDAIKKYGSVLLFIASILCLGLCVYFYADLSGTVKRQPISTSDMARVHVDDPEAFDQAVARGEKVLIREIHRLKRDNQEMLAKIGQLSTQTSTIENNSRLTLSSLEEVQDRAGVHHTAVEIRLDSILSATRENSIHFDTGSTHSGSQTFGDGQSALISPNTSASSSVIHVDE